MNETDGDNEGDFWRDVRKAGAEKRASNRDYGYAALLAAGVRFDCNNAGAHLVVYGHKGAVFDYWPGTGLWMQRGGPRRRGLRELLKRLESEK